MLYSSLCCCSQFLCCQLNYENHWTRTTPGQVAPGSDNKLQSRRQVRKQWQGRNVVVENSKEKQKGGDSRTQVPFEHTFNIALYLKWKT